MTYGQILTRFLCNKCSAFTDLKKVPKGMQVSNYRRMRKQTWTL